MKGENPRGQSETFSRWGGKRHITQNTVKAGMWADVCAVNDTRHGSIEGPSV